MRIEPSSLERSNYPPLECLLAFLSAANAKHLVDGGDEHFPVADLSRVRGFDQTVNGFVGNLVGKDDFPP